MKRKIISLNAGWNFALGGERPAAGAPVCLPHDWALESPIRKDAPQGGSQGFFCREGVGWYWRKLQIDELRAGRRFLLQFGGVCERARVFINGRLCGENGYGYTPFDVDITRALQAGENDVAVRVDNTAAPADRWYSGCGIYRAVSLLEADDVCLDARAVRVNVEFSGEMCQVRVYTGLSLPVCARLFNQQGREAARAEGAGELSLAVDGARRWSAETPYLYTLSLSLAGGDEICMKIGLREVEFVPGQGLFVNKQPVKLHGVCLHQDFACRGVAVKKELWRARLKALKDMGVNFIRAAHHMHSSEFMDLLDEMGFYAYEECFDKWHSGLYNRYFDKDWQKDLDAMVLRDRNRPSVIIWGVGNEVEKQAQDSMLKTLEMLVDRVRALDARPVTYAMNPHFKRPGGLDPAKVKDIQKLVDEVDDQEITDLDERIECIARIARRVDILSCNYQEQWYEAIHAKIPDKLILGTETYQYFMGHRDNMQNYEQTLPARAVEAHPYVIGCAIWTGYDYLGESMRWPSRGWTGSIFRTNGDARFSYYALKALWTKEPLVRIGILDTSLGCEGTKAHWACPPYADAWDLPDGQLGVVNYAICTNCERVEMTVDRDFVLPLPKDVPGGILTGFVSYIPGKIEVRGYNGNALVAVHTLETPGEAARLAFEPAPQALACEEGYEALFTVRARDAAGGPVIRDAREVTFCAEGDAYVVCVDNGDLMDSAPYLSNRRALYHGQASCVIRLGGKPGEVTLTARAEGLECARLKITVG